MGAVAMGVVERLRDLVPSTGERPTNDEQSFQPMVDPLALWLLVYHGDQA